MKARTHNISYPSNAAAMDFSVHLSAQASNQFEGNRPQPDSACIFLRYALSKNTS